MPAEVATLDKPAVSPSGKFILIVLTQNANGNDTQSFQILGQDKTVLYISTEQFTARDTNFFLWDNQDRVWVYSGDLGTFFWENQDEAHTWKKYVYAENNVPAPAFLKEVRPRWHQK
jgi:hypothetical protein